MTAIAARSGPVGKVLVQYVSTKMIIRQNDRWGPKRVDYFWNENDRQNDRGIFVKRFKIWQKSSIFVDYYLWFFNKNACFSTKSKDNDMQFLLENHRFSAIFEGYYLSNLLKICWFWLILIDFVVLKARTRNEFENDRSPKWSLRENFAQKVENHQKWSLILVDKYCKAPNITM